MLSRYVNVLAYVWTAALVEFTIELRPRNVTSSYLTLAEVAGHLPFAGEEVNAS